MSYKLLVFDWDGTLMDSEAQIIGCMQAAFMDLDKQPPRAEEIREIIGLGLREAVMRLDPLAEEELIDALFQRYRHHFFSDPEPAAALFPGVETTLEGLQQAGYLMAVATGKGRRGLDMVLEKTGLSAYFVATRCADETFSKPHPEMLLQLLDFAGVQPDQAVMIGDTEYDLQMAQNAGTHAIAVSYGVHAIERLMQFRPRACLNRIDELPAALAGGV